MDEATEREIIARMERDRLAARPSVYHIRRKPIPGGRGNMWYKGSPPRYNGTYCGADATEYDIRHSDKAVDWELTYCRECARRRDMERPAEAGQAGET